MFLRFTVVFASSSRLFIVSTAWDFIIGLSYSFLSRNNGTPTFSDKTHSRKINLSCNTAYTPYSSETSFIKQCPPFLGEMRLFTSFQKVICQTGCVSTDSLACSGRVHPGTCPARRPRGSVPSRQAQGMALLLSPGPSARTLLGTRSLCRLVLILPSVVTVGVALLLLGVL